MPYVVIEKADAQRAVTAFDNIKSAIEAKGVTVGGAAVEDYGMKITDISAGSEEAEAIPFTVTLWHASGEFINYNFEADIPVQGVTPDSFTSVVFDPEHAVTADRAVVMGTSRELAGMVRIYAMRKPETDLSGYCLIMGKKVQ